MAEATRDGGRIQTGGRRITEEPFNHGYFVEPTLITGLPLDHRLFRDELFVPITVIGEVRVSTRRWLTRTGHSTA